ncbi:hypothetical protein, partial [Sutterella wadsworthensis]
MNGSTGYIDDICISLEVAARIFSRYDSAVIAAFLSSDGGNINRIDVSEINGRSALGIDAAVVVNAFVLSGIDDADELAFALNIKGLIVKNKCFRRVGVIAAINTRYTDIDTVIFIFGCPCFGITMNIRCAIVFENIFCGSCVPSSKNQPLLTAKSTV